MGAAFVQDVRLGTHETAGVLGVSFTATDLVGHKVGPRSQEIQDHVARLDRALETLFDRLDAGVGRGEYVVALSADHGITPIPEQLTAEHVDAGRIDAAKIAETVNALIRPMLGAGDHIAKLDSRDGQLYFAPGV